MDTLILYSTKSGAARECAELLANQLPNSSTFDISRDRPSIKEFDTIIIGSGIRMGSIYGPVKKFIKENLNDLLNVKVIYFYFCNAFPDTLDKTIKRSIPNELISKAKLISSFGGKQPFSNPKNQDWINRKNIDEMIENINENN